MTNEEPVVAMKILLTVAMTFGVTAGGVVAWSVQGQAPMVLGRESLMPLGIVAALLMAGVAMAWRASRHMERHQATMQYRGKRLEHIEETVELLKSLLLGTKDGESMLRSGGMIEKVDRLASKVDRILEWVEKREGG